MSPLPPSYVEIWRTGKLPLIRVHFTGRYQILQSYRAPTSWRISFVLPPILYLLIANLVRSIYLESLDLLRPVRVAQGGVLFSAADRVGERQLKRAL